jgi:DNA polymerase-3 subunit chi
MTDILFYHLERQPLERVLPMLLEKTIERGWRAVVRSITADRVQAIDEFLWNYSDESFLVHAVDGEADPSLEPIFISHTTNEPNQPNVLFLVDGSPIPAEVGSYERIVLMFDGNDEMALKGARSAWKDVRSRGLEGTYWQQNENGRWEKKA